MIYHRTSDWVEIIYSNKPEYEKILDELVLFTKSQGNQYEFRRELYCKSKLSDDEFIKRHLCLVIGDMKYEDNVRSKYVYVGYYNIIHGLWAFQHFYHVFNSRKNIPSINDYTPNGKLNIGQKVCIKDDNLVLADATVKTSWIIPPVLIIDKTYSYTYKEGDEIANVAYTRIYKLKNGVFQ